MAFLKRLYQWLTNLSTHYERYENRVLSHPVPTIVVGLFMVTLSLAALLFVVIPLLFWAYMPPSEITAASISEVKFSETRLYTFIPDETFPLGLVSWYEQRNYGVVTYRSSDDYWGLYRIGDYYVYRTEEVFENLLEPAPERLTGRFEFIGSDRRTKILNLIHDMPPEVIFVEFRTATSSDSIAEAMQLILLAILLLALGQWIYGTGQKAYPKLPRIALVQWRHLVWAWEHIKQLAIILDIIKSLMMIFKSTVSARSNPTQSSSSVQDYEGMTITLSPDKVRKVEVDEE
jgi:hypothetical protein